MKRLSLTLVVLAAACGGRPDVAGEWEGGFYSSVWRDLPLSCGNGSAMIGHWSITQDEHGVLGGKLKICEGTYTGVVQGFSSSRGEVEIDVGFASILNVTQQDRALRGDVSGVDASFRLIPARP